MSVKDVKDYYMKMTADYIEMKDTIDRMESEVTEETAKVVLENIKQLKATAEKVEENYRRISYIMFLLDMPNRKKKRDRYKNQNKKLLNKIPNKDTLEGIQEENNKNLNELKTYIDC